MNSKWLFKELCENFGLTSNNTTDCNPQGNSVLERVHQALGNALRAFELEEQELDEENPWEPFMTTVAHTIRSAHHTTLQASPGQIAFGRDMVLPVSMRTDWVCIAQ